MNARFQIDCNFPGGNIRVLRIEGDHIYLAPDLRDTEIHWFYWNFRVCGAQGKTLHFVFEGGPCIGALGPAISRNAGASWDWLGQHDIGDAEESFFYAFEPEEDCIHFAFCIPYTWQNWRTFAETLPESFRRETFVRTPRGHESPLVKTVPTSGSRRVIVSARHHCCETTPSFVIEGLLQAWQPSLDVQLVVIPFMDLDGVEAGDQGKMRRPHDHNRDYVENSIYPETRAFRDLIGSEPTRFVALDLHCPYLRGESNETVYSVGSKSPEMRAEQERFGTILENCAEGLPYRLKNDILFGIGWNTAKNFSEGKSSTEWVIEQDNCQLGVLMEIPYANAEGIAITGDTARTFGRGLARALVAYLHQNP